MNGLTVIIPCKDDPEVVRCIQSIDDGSPALVVFNGSSDAFISRVKHELRHHDVSFEQLAHANLAQALQHGIDSAETDQVLLMDSDCRFRPRSITAMKLSLGQKDPEQSVHKGRIEFERDSSKLSRVIARSRHQHTARRLSAYKPPLAFSRLLAPRIGGYFFDPRLRWKEDADLDRRVREAVVEIVSVEGCIIDHGALAFLQDMRSNFRYGIGAALAEHLKIDLPAPSRSVTETLVNEGFSVAAYMALANQARTAGWALARLKLVLRRENGLRQTP